jgi:hypothetical protein
LTLKDGIAKFVSPVPERGEIHEGVEGASFRQAGYVADKRLAPKEWFNL